MIIDLLQAIPTWQFTTAPDNWSYPQPHAKS